MKVTANLLKKAQNLVHTYDGKDAPIYKRKFQNLSEKLSQIMSEIFEKEERDLDDVRKSVARMSEHEDDEEKLRGKICSLIFRAKELATPTRL